MPHNSERSATIDLDTQLLSDFIYALNIARRQLALYPPEHPQIQASSEAALAIFAKLCQFRETITLGVAPETLVFENNWLDGSNPVYRDFSHFLSALDIAAISFHSGLDAQELIQFNQILSQSWPEGEEANDIPQRLAIANITHVAVMPVNYAVFQGAEGAAQETESGLLWEDFLHGLLGEQLDPDGHAIGVADRLNSELLAEIMNSSEQGLSGKNIDYDQVISSFVAKIQGQEQQSLGAVSAEFGQLTQKLNPAMKRNFLNSTFRALRQHPQAAETLLQNFPQELLQASLHHVNSQEDNISARLVDLLGQFSTAASSDKHLTSGTSAKLPDEILQSRIDVLLLEDNHDEFLPSDYQKTLDKILTGEIRGTIEPQMARDLKNNLEKQSVEKQCCTIIFNMLHNRVDQDVENLLQDNLSELSHFFLDTGDFQALRDIYLGWSQHLYNGMAQARFLDEKVLAEHTGDVFMNLVLDSIELWGKDKYDDICAYIKEIGEPYTELLIERLANDEQMSQRKTWMKLLVELGKKGHQIIFQHLDDKRWYLIRNLLIVLGKQREAMPMKAVHQLTAHPHPKVRQEAIRILFRLNPATANRLLLKELSSGNRQSLPAAVQLAEISQDDKVLNQLHHLLQSEGHTEEDFALKKQILNTLAFLGRPESIPVLAKLLKKRGFIRSRRDKDFHQEIINHLGAYPRHASEPLLNAIINGRDRSASHLARRQIELHQVQGAPK
ncbi:MAG: hypothetical protein JXQ81_00955 [Desulfuromonadales bacterium]|nr:hypothetical protein [Desulfuromonadales bacterium]MBN2791053.1 hypothetical protein [Desulfuromonadales bacterium]